MQLYNLYHENSSKVRWASVACDVNFVSRMVEAYLRGENSIKYNSETYKVPTSVFHIYEVPMTYGSDVALIRRKYREILRTEYNRKLDEQMFAETCENVTLEFLSDRERGSIVDYFNLYINDGNQKPILTVLTRKEIVEFESQFAQGLNSIWIDSRSISLSKPKQVKVFDIEFKWLAKERGIVKSEIRKVVNGVFSGEWNVRALEYFGKEVTAEFSFREFGILANDNQGANSAFDWNIIDEKIASIAKPRFLASLYADAVEACYKELNNLVKKEYVRLKGKEEDGVNLMRKALGTDTPPIRLTEMKSDSDCNIQQGYMNIFAGVMQGIRNPKAHANLEIDKLEAWEKIVLANHLYKMWMKRVG